MLNLRSLLISIFLLCLSHFSHSQNDAQLVTLDCDHLELIGDEFVYENDTLKITYDFYSDNGTMKFTIYNKTDKPLYFDWKKSAYIINERKFAYWADEAEINARTTGYQIQWLEWLSTETSKTIGTIKSEDRIEFIPPRTKTAKDKFRLSKDEHIKTFKGPEISLINKNWKKNKSNQTELKTYSFNRSSTPLEFRNFVTYSFTEDFTEEISLDFSFWVTEILEMDPRQIVATAYYNLDWPKYFDEFKHPYRAPNRYIID